MPADPETTAGRYMTVRVLAATFNDRQAAQGVLRELRDLYQLGPDDASVAPLGTAGDGTDRLTVLAGRFRDERIGEVKHIIERRGGEVVADVDKRWTDPWPEVRVAGSQEERLP